MSDTKGLIPSWDAEAVEADSLRQEVELLRRALASARSEVEILERLAEKADKLIESQRETIAVQTEAYQGLLDHHYSLAQRRARFDKEVVKTEQLLRGYPAEDTVH